MTSEDFVERFFCDASFYVQRIEEGNTKRPDFLVADGVQKYLVEVKDKLPDLDKLLQRDLILVRGEVYVEEQAMGYQNVVSYVIREAAAQLSAYDDEPVDFKLVWLQARGQHPEAQLEQFKATLYGSTDMVDLAELGASVPSRPCFYFMFSEFFGLRAVLDGAIISTEEKGFLCLNALSPRCTDLKSSHLYEIFYPGVCDPSAKEAIGEAYIADCNTSRRDKTTVLRYVQEKYGRPKLIDLEMNQYSAEILIPWNRKD